MRIGADLPPRARAPLLLIGFVSLASGMLGGLLRAGVPGVDAPGMAVAVHGPLMVAAFFGTVIALERAVALARLWAYLAPLGCGLGGVALLIGQVQTGAALLVAGAGVLFGANTVILRRAPSLEVRALATGAACLVVGNALVLLRFGISDAVPWWIGFFALTIGGERLELSRYAPRPAHAAVAFVVVAVALVAAAALAMTAPHWGWPLLGAGLLGLAAWLLAYDIARHTVRQQALTRYIAVCLLSGYAWLALAGGLCLAGPAVAGPRYDAMLHALFVGFVFSMVFGHAPVIFPAILRVAIPYTGWLYLPLVLLHATLALRTLGDLAAVMPLRTLGSLGNAVAIAVFIVTVVTRVATHRR